MMRWLTLLLGIAGVWIGVERWLWFQRLPRCASAHWCGNCFAGFVLMPSEIGILGLLLVVASLMRIRPTRSDIPWWCCAVVGVLLTPLIIGVPVFAVSFLLLAWSWVERRFGAKARPAHGGGAC